MFLNTQIYDDSSREFQQSLLGAKFVCNGEAYPYCVAIDTDRGYLDYFASNSSDLWKVKHRIFGKCEIRLHNGN